jgi:hypothetical protein
MLKDRKLNMGCAPSNEALPTTKNHDQTAANNNIILTTDERLKLKEVWVIVKQNGLKKLGDDIMNRYIMLQENLFNSIFTSF